ncbi:MAG: quinoprotein relay system zinc metallohydrolase 2 [Nitrosomonadales bacterium]|nr:quinoprotein relay system zinc metallohydrolase 2 [Nitrosomonadales bacterium]
MLKKLLMLLMLWVPVFAVAEPLPVEQIAPGIYVHHGVHRDIDADYGGDICNIGFIVGNKGVAVIDSGGSPRIGAQLREAIRNITQLPIRYVINTHVHPDHVFGNAAFKDDHPVFVGHEKLASAMMQRRDAYLRNQINWVGADAAGSELIPPTLAVHGSQTIDLGGRSLQLTAHAAAHTNNDLTVFDSATATLWTGDLLFVERTPSIDGDLKGWLTVIPQLRSIPAQRAVPGHGPVVADWRSALDDESRYLATLLEDVRAAIKQGKSMEQAIGESTQSEQGRWVLFDIVNRRNIGRVFPELEWE